MTNYIMQCDNVHTTCANTCCHLHLSITCVLIAISFLIIFYISYFVYRYIRDKRELDYLEKMHYGLDMVVINNKKQEYRFKKDEIISVKNEDKKIVIQTLKGNLTIEGEFKINIE